MLYSIRKKLDSSLLNKIKYLIRHRKVQKKYLNFYNQFIKEGDLCFDIGANMGNRTKAFLKLGAEVVAVEPTDKCNLVLHENFKKNNKVTIIKKAIGATNGFADIHLGNYHELSTLSKDFIEKYSGQATHQIEWNRTEKVELITLDQLIKTHGLPIFCKIDVEGYESEVLKGLSQAIPCLSFEFNQKLKYKALECLNILSKFENCMFNFSAYETMQFSFNTWKTSTDFYVFVKELPNDILTGDVYVKMLP